MFWFSCLRKLYIQVIYFASHYDRVAIAYMAKKFCRTKLSNEVLLWLCRRRVLNKQVDAAWQRFFCCCFFFPSICMHMNSISRSQKERLLCNLTYLFCFCEANTPFPRDSMSKAFILCTLWLGTVLVCGRVCIHILVYLVVSLAHSRIIMDFTHQSVIVL